MGEIAQTSFSPMFAALATGSNLPIACEPWPTDAAHSGAGVQPVIESLKSTGRHGAWHWPDRPLVFVSDPHADAESFLRSLSGAGVIQRHGAGATAFSLTGFGHACRIVIGGDCLDKGPSNLDMLDALAALIATGADLHLIAGNHDLRMRVAIQALGGPRSPLTDHLFVRMGRKIVPLLREVFDRYVAPRGISARIPDEAACRDRIFPPEDWPDRFPALAAAHLSREAIAREVSRLERKREAFDAEVARTGLSMRDLFAATRVCHQLFLEPGGDYAWFYRAMEVICRCGSLLFVHAGLDDSVCALLAHGGTEEVNRRFRNEAARDPFAFYTGAVANLARTKYRTTDPRLTHEGVARLHATGVKMVVQGHVNNHAGQRLLAKHGLLHLEGDITLDRVSRQREGLHGIGAGATLVFPSGDILGLSTDYPRAKHFNPAQQPWKAE
ncbi:metallophosphoesterase [Tropicimonas marinistellae]|uniref:metallophosphoesterase n=1 Tax=Tropicimonas marinistellae TaxID=1739787 RepID=UPI000ACACAA6|nr:metallophosphoesterase [Tropicimonas marinistellae]